MNIERVVVAIRTINRLHNLGDAVYEVRETEANTRSLRPNQSSWEGAAVKEYSAAVAVLQDEGVIS